ncbi:MAG: hypothetical protein R2815_12055 [Flavobacteriales bacterium]|nr:hypothetical protein [Flavobacteriales bacterium]
MEYFWLTIAIGTAVGAGWVIATKGFEQGDQWLIFPGISLAMYIFRRMTRRKLEAMDDRAKAARG